MLSFEMPIKYPSGEVYMFRLTQGFLVSGNTIGGYLAVSSSKSENVRFLNWPPIFTVTLVQVAVNVLANNHSSLLQGKPMRYAVLEPGCTLESPGEPLKHSDKRGLLLRDFDLIVLEWGHRHPMF